MDEYKDYGSFLTGFPSLDHYLMGVPRGFFLEISGRESSYKTTLLQQVFGHIQERNKEVRYLYIDTEGNVTKEYFEACGGDSSITEFIQENVIEEILTYVHKFVVESNKEEIPCLVAVDSIAGFTTLHELKQGISKATQGDVPRILNRFLRTTAVRLKEYGSTVIFNNQLRDDLNSQWGGTVTPGGHGMRHWAKYRVKMYDWSSNSKQYELANGEIAHPVTFLVEKGKNQNVYKGFGFSMDVILGKGFSRELDVIQFGIDNGFIEQKGHYYTLPTGEKFNSKNNLHSFLTETPDLVDMLYKDMLDK